MSTNSAQLSCLERVDGSALFSWEGNRVMASVTGPIEAKFRDEKIDRLYLEVQVRPSQAVSGSFLLSSLQIEVVDRSKGKSPGSYFDKHL